MYVEGYWWTSYAHPKVMMTPHALLVKTKCSLVLSEYTARKRRETLLMHVCRQNHALLLFVERLVIKYRGVEGVLEKSNLH